MNLEINKIYHEEANQFMAQLPPNSVDLIVTSPPYFGLRHYGGETLGRERDPRKYVRKFMTFSSNLRRILKPTGSMYLNLGDVYFGTKGYSRSTGRAARKTDHHYQNHEIAKPDGKYLQYKQLLLLPARIAIALQDAGWVVRNDLIWHKPNAFPNHAPDRRLPMYEHIFHITKAARGYYFNYALAKELGNNKDMLCQKIETHGAHQAAYPLELIEPLIATTSQKK